MRFDVRTRLLGWLVLATMPVMVAGLAVVTQLERSIEVQVEEDLSNLLQLQVAGVTSALAAQETDGAQIAARDALVFALERHAAVTSTRAPADLSSTADFLVGEGTPVGDGLEAVRIVDRSTRVLGQSEDFSWTPWDDGLVERSMDERRPLFGDAFVSDSDDERLGLVVPVVASDGAVLDAVQLEHRLDSVVGSSIGLEAFGATTEAVIVQPLEGDRGQLITLRRVDRDAAFSAVVDVRDLGPAGLSLSSPTPRVERLDHDGGEPTVAAVQTISPTGWGLIITMDESEAFELSDRLTRTILVGIAITMALLVGGWATMVLPLGRRLKRTAVASERVAGDDHPSRISDTASDEIGEVARVTGSGEHPVGSSIGSATSTPGGSPHAVLVEADTSMYRMKHAPSPSRTSPGPIRLVEEALAADRVEVHYQPVVRFRDDIAITVGAEALVRVRDRAGELIPPDDFLPGLGTGDVARALDTRVMHDALRTFGDWRRRDVVTDDFQMALNIGSASMSDPHLVTRVEAELRRHDTTPGSIIVEITETVEVVDDATLDAFRHLGVKLAIDDVGCRHSNLERLVDVAADIAKIDRRWVSDDSTRGSGVLAGLVGQCATLGFDIVAEGVETQAQVDTLQALGVEIFQGYLFGRPSSAASFEHHWGRLTTAELDRIPSIDDLGRSVAQDRIEQQTRLAVDDAVDGSDPTEYLVEVTE